jgi:hypothetical protein
MIVTLRASFVFHFPPTFYPPPPPLHPSIVHGAVRRAPVPAAAVPDELVQRVLEILPSKSRQAVVRQVCPWVQY